MTKLSHLRSARAMKKNVVNKSEIVFLIGMSLCWLVMFGSVRRTGCTSTVEGKPWNPCGPDATVTLLAVGIVISLVWLYCIWNWVKRSREK